MNTATKFLCSPRQLHDVLHTLLFVFFCSIFLLSTGCATVGHDFPEGQVKEIRINKTTQEEIRTMFGEPWRIGLEDGLQTWSYGTYHYRIFSEKDAKDLVVRFTDDNIVESYTFNTTNR